MFEIIHPDHPRGGFRFGLFDFDGTVSLIREGWQAVMIPMMVEILQETHSGETEAELTRCVQEYVERLTGRQTIYQMLQLKAEVERRGGKALDALEYKRIYLARLAERIKHRIAGLRDGTIQPSEMMLPGTVEMLTGLKERGVTLFLASGTDVAYVEEECALLGLCPYFEGRIYGALDDYKKFSKKILIDSIFRENRLHGSELLCFGDGFVEIENTKEAGGVAIGVGSDEVGKKNVNPRKRERLIQAGADVIIPHYQDHETLLAYLFAEE